MFNGQPVHNRREHRVQKLLQVLMAASMTVARKLVLTGALLLTLLAPTTTAGDQNYALNGVTYQYDAYDDNCTFPSKAVDGSVLQDMTSCQCAQTGSVFHLPYKPWWVVKLRKWAQVSSFRVIGSNTPLETRDSGYSFLLAPFWNDSLPSIVASNSPTSDLISSMGFSVLTQYNGSLHDFPNATTTFNTTFRAVGRYFAVQSPLQPVMLCEMEVLGKESVLASSGWKLLTDNALYQSYNLSVLNDDREDTCLQLGSANDGQVVIFQSASPVAGRLSAIILSKGGLQGQSARACQSGVSLRVSLRRAKDGAWVEDPICTFAAVQQMGNLMMHRFECDCIDCQAMLVVELGWSGAGISQTIEICEAMAFPSTLPAAGANVPVSAVSVRPDCDPSDRYCCPTQQVYSVKYGLWTSSGEYVTATAVAGIQMTFVKAYSNTDLRVVLIVNTRCNQGCCRLYLTYNGNECANPAKNEIINRNYHTQHSHWSATLEGICKGIPAGNVVISLNAALCDTAGSSGIGVMGTTRLIVEETDAPQNNSTPSCPHAAVFNSRQSIFSTATDADTGTLFTTNYTKSAPETALKITFDGTAKVTGLCAGQPDCCGYWQFLINGLACSNPGPIAGMLAETPLNYEFHLPLVFSGVCYNISAGPLVVSLTVSTCAGYTTTADVYTGYSAASHILIEEVRENTPFLSPKATPVFNLKNYYFSLSTPIDSGLLTSVNYTKTRSDTALRVSWVGYIRISTPATAGIYENAWHVVFNGQECADPGTINMVYLLASSSFSQVRTGYNFGICRGIAIGNVTVGLKAAFMGSSPWLQGDITTTGGMRVAIQEVFLTP